MSLIRHLNPLEYKAIGILEFKAETPLHIGTGMGDVRRTLIRIPRDKGFLIPSSTWKGVFRSISEKIAKSMNFKDKLAELAIKSFKEEHRAIYEVDEEFCKDVLNVLRGGASSIIPYSYKDLIEISEDMGFTSDEINEIRDRGFSARDNLLYRLSESILAVHDPVGKLYGNHVLAGKLRFLDTILKPGIYKITLHERPSVAIDRHSGRVREKAFFILESITSERIKMMVIADNLIPSAEDSKLFASTLETIESFGLNLGARKSAGMGWLTLNSEVSHWYIVNLKDDKGGVKIARPFKYTETRNVREFLRWLHG